MGAELFLDARDQSNTVRVLAENYIQKNLSALVYSCLCILHQDYTSWHGGLYHKNKQRLNQIKRLKRWKDDINYVLKNLKPNPNQSLPNLEKVGFEATQRRYCEDVFGDSERAEAAQVILKFIQQEMRLFDRM